MSTVTATRGVLGIKLGMTQVWDDNNLLIPVTVIQVAPNVVTQIRTQEIDGYEAIQIASGGIDPRKVTQPLKGPLREGRGHPSPSRDGDSHQRHGELHRGPGAHR